MEEIKGTYRNEECFEYKVHGKTHWIKPDIAVFTGTVKNIG